MKINGVIGMLKRKAPKVIQINDIINWYEKDELDYSPKYQRNSVWNIKAKSYLLDTIIRGLPVPPIFMRQKIDVNTRKTYREIIDGQQRIRAIIDFVNDKFAISKMHNELYGNKYFSQLDDDVKEAILDYDLFAEIINETDDAVIYDMFARLNTNNCVLNNQELRNAKFWGEFKVAAYNNAAEYREIFYNNKIFTDKQFSRMADVELISTLYDLIINGIESETPSSIDKLYKTYDESFDNYETFKKQFDLCMKVIVEIYNYLNGNIICFTSKTYFYTLFAVVYNQLFGLDIYDLSRRDIYNENNIFDNIDRFIDRIVAFENVIDTCINNDDSNNPHYITIVKFAKHHKTRTTSKAERIERVKILNDFIIGA